MTIRASRSCRRCGVLLPENARFCAECGAPVAQPPPPPRDPSEPVPATPRHRAFWPVVATGSVLALAGLAICLLALGGTGPLAANGRWLFSSNEDGIQVIYLRTAAADDAGLFRLACNTEDGVLWMNSRALAGDEVEQRATTRHRLDLTLTGGGRSLVVEGYVSRAPEGASTSYEAPRSSDLMAILGAPDFSVSGPSLTVRAGGASGLAAFVRACPAVASRNDDKLGWGTITSLVNGYRLQYPRRLFRVTAGDRFGRAYEADAGHARLVVMAHVNALGQTLADAVKAGEAGLPALDQETYRSVTGDSVVVSGVSQGTIVYFKVRATCANANFVSFTLRYDAGAREMFDPIVARMSRSLDARTLPRGQPLCP